VCLCLRLCLCCVPAVVAFCRLQRKLVSSGIVGMVCRLAERIDKVVYPASAIPYLPPLQRAEKQEAMTQALRESLRRSCSAALGNLSYVRCVACLPAPCAPM
jgi:hypothetical protein